jgi:DcmR-like sensory protein
MTSAPIRFAGSTLRDRAHICAFFSSPDEAYRVLLPFVKEGLELGEKALHTIDPRQREDHIRWLASAGIDVAAAHNKEQIEVLDWTDSHLRGGRFDQEWTLAFWGKVADDAKRKGFPLVRFVSQMEWVLETDLDLNELLEYEAKANDAWLRQDGPVNPAICVYDLRKFRGDIVVDVMRTHPLVIIGGVLQENPFFVPPDEFLRELRERRDNPSGAAAAA